MTVVERIRQINASHGMACAELDIDDDTGFGVTACFWVDEVPFVTLRRARIAWALGKCPLCFWILVRSFGLTKEQTG